jgi:putative dimethyl sulfoxide reductase chaperone
MLNVALKNKLVARAHAYRLLADCYYLPGPGLRRSVEALGATLRQMAPEAAGCALELKASIDRQADLAALQVDYARLFVGPFSLVAPPYGSVYLEKGRRVMGDSTINVQAWLAAEGLDVADGYRDAPDHIAAELEFMHFLYCQALNALLEGDDQEAFEYIRKGREFLAQHLGKWVAEFTHNIAEGADSGFYRSLALVTESFIEQELCWPDAQSKHLNPPSNHASQAL